MRIISCFQAFAMTTDKTDTCLLWGFGRCEGEGLETAAGCCCCCCFRLFSSTVDNVREAKRPERSGEGGGGGGGVAAGPPRLLAERARWPSICPRRQGKHRQIHPQSRGGCQLEDIGVFGVPVPSKVRPPTPTTTPNPRRRGRASRLLDPLLLLHTLAETKAGQDRRRLSTPEGGGDTTFLATLTLHNELTSSSRQLHF